MTSVLGIYFALFVSLPVTVKVYEFVTGDRRKKEEEAVLKTQEAQTTGAPDMLVEEEKKEGPAKETLSDCLFILVLTGVLGLVSNLVGYKGNPIADFTGSALLVIIAFAGILIAHEKEISCIGCSCSRLCFFRCFRYATDSVDAGRSSARLGCMAG